VDPHSLYADPVPAFEANPDSDFKVKADPAPGTGKKFITDLKKHDVSEFPLRFW
jgi:hypothetical protein